VLIFGAGQVAQVFARTLKDYYSSISHVVDSQHWQPGLLTPDLLDRYYNSRYRFIVGMSFKGLNAPRAEKYQAMLDKGYEPITYVDIDAINRGTVGCGSFVMELNNIQHGVEIGENCILWSGNHIGHHTKIGNHVFIASHAVIGGSCEIGDYSFIGVNATIRDGVKIGPRCVIGAGALILSDCEEGGVYSPGGTERSRVPSSRLRNI